jgi:hypothetical protein
MNEGSLTGVTSSSFVFIHAQKLRIIALSWIQYTNMQLQRVKAGSLKMNTALEYCTRVVQEGGRRCKKSTLNDLVHLTPLRIPLMNPPLPQPAAL